MDYATVAAFYGEPETTIDQEVGGIAQPISLTRPISLTSKGSVFRHGNGTPAISGKSRLVN